MILSYSHFYENKLEHSPEIQSIFYYDPRHQIIEILPYNIIKVNANAIPTLKTVFNLYKTG